MSSPTFQLDPGHNQHVNAMVATPCSSVSKSKDRQTKQAVTEQHRQDGNSYRQTETTNNPKGYSEPPDARKPNRRWSLYPSIDRQALPTLHIHRQRSYIIGRSRQICDLPIDHPSCSKQHAVLQYRLVPNKRRDCLCIRPYILDLESANGTFINFNQIEPLRFLQLFEKDVLSFGYSSCTYVLLDQDSKPQP
ncbi:smad nuclear-interacting protein 1-like [Anopheles cruzii]|uniref:smad nuclear-interacting protein 1-like n=1 Tax=Anopheles cruzii TaxID=68878 RepID=UPI0022EC77D2|nr:smad nuclear-interacting protein 1-like [Anopheles cruzii]